MPLSDDRILLGALYALATSFVMSVAAALIKYTATLVSIELIVLAQYLICVIFMLPWLLRGGTAALKTQHLKLHIVRALCGWACFYTYYLAIREIPLVDATLLRNAAPLCVPFYVYWIHKVRIASLRWLPLLAGFLGVGLILKPESQGLSYWHLVGFGSAITLAGSIVTTRMLTRTEPTGRIIFYYFAFSTLASLPLALPHLHWPSAEALGLMLLIALSIWLTMWLYTQAYLHAKASVISPISYAGVIFAGFWGWYFWQQTPDLITLIGVCLVSAGGIGSVLLGAREEKRSRSI